MSEKDKYISGLVETGAIIVKGADEEPFELKSGGVSRIYVDHARVATQHEYFKAMIEALGVVVSEFIGDEGYSVMNVDSKVSAQMVGAYSALRGVDQIVHKNDSLLAREKGTRKKVTGGSDRIVMLDDVGTSGRTIIEAAGVVREVFELVELNAIVALVREPDEFFRNLEVHDIGASWLVDLDEALVANIGGFSDSQKLTLVRERGLQVDN